MNVEGEVWDPILQGSISPCGAFGICLKKSESKIIQVFLPFASSTLERHGETWRDVERPKPLSQLSPDF